MFNYKIRNTSFDGPNPPQIGDTFKAIITYNKMNLTIPASRIRKMDLLILFDMETVSPSSTKGDNSHTPPIHYAIMPVLAFNSRSVGVIM